MRLFIKGIGVFILAFLIFSFSIIDCCLLESAQAGTVIQKEVHFHSESDVDTSGAESCLEDELSATVPNQHSYLRNFETSGYNFYPSVISYDVFGNSALISNKLSALHLPPLISANLIPIYVKNSTLRI